MQAAPIAPIAVDGSWANILPGPFILLLLLPAFPLILFSIGARPPDTSALPFTTDDLWQTTAFITVAGAVVLSMGLYPGMLSDVTSWVKDGSGGVWRAYLVDIGNILSSESAPVEDTSATEQTIMQFSARHQSQHLPGHYQQYDPRRRRGYGAPLAQPPAEQVIVRYEDVPATPARVEYRPPEYRQNRQGNVVYRPGAKRVIPGTKAGKRMVVETIKVHQPPHAHNLGHLSLSRRHLVHLRESSLKAFYSPVRPPLWLVLLVLTLTVTFLIILTGKILHATYDADTTARKTSPSSKGAEVDPWHIRELSKRKKESEKQTIARNKDQEASFVGKLAKMDSIARDKEIKKKKQEMEMLRKELKQRRLPLVAMDWDYEGKGKKKSPSRDKAPTKNHTEKPAPSKLKKLLLGPLADGVPKKADPKGLPAEGGPGWKPADDAVAHAAIRGGAARAETMANSLIAQKG